MLISGIHKTFSEITLGIIVIISLMRAKNISEEQWFITIIIVKICIISMIRIKNLINVTSVFSVARLRNTVWVISAMSNMCV